MRVISTGLLTALIGTVGCSNPFENPKLPEGVLDPKQFENEDGAVRLSRTAILEFQRAWAEGTVLTGLITDELEFTRYQYTSYYAQSVDFRSMPESNPIGPVSDLYIGLHKARGYFNQAIGMFQTYAPSRTGSRAEMYALLGYSELMLADAFCSGVPLSTLDFQGDYTYQPSSSTEAIYRHTVALFDTAIALAVDSLPIQNLARVGKGRALLSLGLYDSAATAVADVPDGYRYTFSVYWDQTWEVRSVVGGAPSIRSANWGAVPDREGGNGQPWISSGDPRTRVGTIMTIPASTGGPQAFPAKYPANQSSPLVLADAIEDIQVVLEDRSRLLE